VKKIYRNLKEKDEVEKLGISRILGSSSTAGVVGTINDDLKELGNFTMHEGRLEQIKLFFIRY